MTLEPSYSIPPSCTQEMIAGILGTLPCHKHDPPPEGWDPNLYRLDSGTSDDALSCRNQHPARTALWTWDTIASVPIRYGDFDRTQRYLQHRRPSERSLVVEYCDPPVWLSLLERNDVSLLRHGRYPGECHAGRARWLCAGGADAQEPQRAICIILQGNVERGHREGTARGICRRIGRRARDRRRTHNEAGTRWRSTSDGHSRAIVLRGDRKVDHRTHTAARRGLGVE